MVCVFLAGDGSFIRKPPSQRVGKFGTGAKREPRANSGWCGAVIHRSSSLCTAVAAARASARQAVPKFPSPLSVRLDVGNLPALEITNHSRRTSREREHCRARHAPRTHPKQQDVTVTVDTASSSQSSRPPLFPQRNSLPAFSSFS